MMGKLFVVATLLAGVAGILFVPPSALRPLTDGLALTDPVRPPILVVFFIDSSPGSSGSLEHLRLAASEPVALLAERPGRLEVWVLGESLATTTMVLGLESPGPGSAVLRVRRSFRDRWVNEARAALEGCEIPATRRKSPIAAGLTKIALRMSEWQHDKAVIVLSDLLEMDAQTYRLECQSPLPSTDEFLKTLHEHEYLTPGSLSNVAVVVGFFAPGLIDSGCPTTIARFLQVRTLWERAFTAAGGRVMFFSETPSMKGVL